ncbi:MAG: LptF/LptG family permease, partial [Planctomycetota bacterium]
FAVGALLFIALPGIAVNTVHKLPNVDAGVLLQFLPLVLQSLTPYVLPLCFMLSVVSVYGRLAADKEWIAIQMAGIHPLKTLFAPFLVATGLGLVTFWMVSSELPQLKKRQKSFLVNATASVIKNVQPGKTRLQFDDFLLLANARDPETGAFTGVYVRRPKESEDERPTDIFARIATLEVVREGDEDKLQVRVRDLQAFDPRTGESFQKGATDFKVNLSNRLERKTTNYDRAKYMVSGDIRRRLREIDSGEKEVEPSLFRELRYMLHYRASMFAIFYLFLGLGAATGLLMRRGTQLGALAVAAGYGILYFVLSLRLGKELGRSGTLPPWVGAWLAIVLGGIAAVLLLRRAIRR